MLTPSSRLVFFHIPKTSGTTLSSIIRKNYPREDVARCYAQSAPAPTEQDEAELLSREIETGLRAGAAVIMGHFPLSKIDHRVRSTYKTLAFLRDPVERWISEYFHLQRSEDEKHRQIVAALPDVESRLNHPRTQNVHCQYLSDIPFSIERNNMDEVYERARRNLRENLDVIGITERFDDSIVALRCALGWKHTRYNQRNFNPQPGLAEDIRKHFNEQLRTANAYDIELYREAISLFDCQLRSTPFFGLRKRLLSGTRQLARHPHAQ